MKLLEAKINLEQYISTNYVETTIHWSGMPFDTTAHSEWVHFLYLGEMISDCGFDNDVFSQSGTLQVTVIAQTPFRCNQIADIILDMFKGKKISELFAGRVILRGQSYIEEIDKSALEFDVLFDTF